MRHSQLEGQRHLEAGGKNEGEEMPWDISDPELFSPSQKVALSQEMVLSRNFFLGCEARYDK